MLEHGYIKIYRSLVNWEWYQDGNTSRVFLHLLLTVNYETQKWRGMEVQRGQRVASYQVLAAELRLSVQNIRTAIKHLISTGEITHKATPEYGVFTVNNYDRFQSLTPMTTDSQQSANSQPTVGQQLCNKDNKSNKEKEGNNTPLSSASGDACEGDSPNASFAADGESNSPSATKRGKRKPDGPPKTQYAEFVSMTDDEYSSLIDKLGEYGIKRCVEILDNYKGASGKRYTSDYRAILSWVIKRYEEEQARTLSPNGNTAYTSGHKETTNERNNRLLAGFFGEEDEAHDGTGIAPLIERYDDEL